MFGEATFVSNVNNVVYNSGIEFLNDILKPVIWTPAKTGQPTNFAPAMTAWQPS